jgi:hypothetical protein
MVNTSAVDSDGFPGLTGDWGYETEANTELKWDCETNASMWLETVREFPFIIFIGLLISAIVELFSGLSKISSGKKTSAKFWTVLAMARGRL